MFSNIVSMRCTFLGGQSLVTFHICHICHVFGINQNISIVILFKVNEYPWMAIFAKPGGLDQGGCGATLVIVFQIMYYLKLYPFPILLKKIPRHFLVLLKLNPFPNLFLQIAENWAVTAAHCFFTGDSGRQSICSLGFIMIVITFIMIVINNHHDCHQ